MDERLEKYFEFNTTCEPTINEPVIQNMIEKRKQSLWIALLSFASFVWFVLLVLITFITQNRFMINILTLGISVSFIGSSLVSLCILNYKKVGA